MSSKPARAMREGLEPELSVAMDVMYPDGGAHEGGGAQPEDLLPYAVRLYVEAPGGVIKPVLDRQLQHRRHWFIAARARRASIRNLAKHSIRDRRPVPRIR
jgi:hypothetical protein